MAMKKFLRTGFGPATTEENIPSFLREFGPVTGLDVVGSGSFIVIDETTNNTVAAGMIA